MHYFSSTLAGPAEYNQGKMMKLCCPLRSVGLFSYGNKEFVYLGIKTILSLFYAVPKTT